jgi:hypothetical protein
LFLLEAKKSKTKAAGAGATGMFTPTGFKKSIAAWLVEDSNFELLF